MENWLKWFIIGIIISFVWSFFSTIFVVLTGGKKSNSYEPFWLKSIIVIWAILAGINDKK